MTIFDKDLRRWKVSESARASSDWIRDNNGVWLGNSGDQLLLTKIVTRRPNNTNWSINEKVKTRLEMISSLGVYCFLKFSVEVYFKGDDEPLAYSPSELRSAYEDLKDEFEGPYQAGEFSHGSYYIIPRESVIQQTEYNIDEIKERVLKESWRAYQDWYHREVRGIKCMTFPQYEEEVVKVCV